MIADLPFVVLKARLKAAGGRDLDGRTVRLLGRYRTWDQAVDAAVAACRAARYEEDAPLYRYKVTTADNAPPSALRRSSPRTDSLDRWAAGLRGGMPRGPRLPGQAA